MSSTRAKLKLFVAAAVSRFSPAGPARAAREEPRTERFFDRPFPFLVRCAGVLVPVVVAFGAAPARGDGAGRERAGVEAEARAARN